MCDVYDSIEINNTIQMVTELCSGQDLASYAQTPCSEITARPIVIQILGAVNYMHKRGLFHHHLSLENSKNFCLSSCNELLVLVVGQLLNC